MRKIRISKKLRKRRNRKLRRRSRRLTWRELRRRLKKKDVTKATYDLTENFPKVLLIEKYEVYSEYK